MASSANSMAAAILSVRTASSRTCSRCAGSLSSPSGGSNPVTRRKLGGKAFWMMAPGSSSNSELSTATRSSAASSSGSMPFFSSIFRKAWGSPLVMASSVSPRPFSFNNAATRWAWPRGLALCLISSTRSGAASGLSTRISTCSRASFSMKWVISSVVIHMSTGMATVGMTSMKIRVRRSRRTSTSSLRNTVSIAPSLMPALPPD